jgi:hypothetical protein
MDNVQNCGSYINIPSSQTYTRHILLAEIVIVWSQQIAITEGLGIITVV